MSASMLACILTRQTDRQTGRQADRQTGRESDRPTDGQKHTMLHACKDQHTHIRLFPARMHPPVLADLQASLDALAWSCKEAVCRHANHSRAHARRDTHAVTKVHASIQA